MSDNFKEVGNDPGDLNDFVDPCLASGIGGSIIPEDFVINRVCQDPNNLGIVYMECTLSGVFDYTPNLIIRYTNYLGNPDATLLNNKFIFGYKNAAESVRELPIKTSCGSVNLLLAWDVSALIPNWASLKEVTFELTMKGEFGGHSFDDEIIDKLNQIFESIDPSDTAVLTKGVTPKPYKIYFDEQTNQFRVQYAGLGDQPCKCDIDCANISAQDQDLVVCDNEIQELILDANSIVGDPTNIDITFRDVIGNETNLSTQILSQVKPMTPDVFWFNSPSYIQINPHYVTSANRRISPDNTKIQIWKYVDSKENVSLLKDWSSKPWKVIFDRDVEVGYRYGYAIRFMGEFGEVSDLSDWFEVNLERAAQVVTVQWDNMDSGPYTPLGGVEVDSPKYNRLHVVEDVGTVALTITLDEGSSSDEYIEYSIAGTAVDGVNYTAPSSPLMIPAGDTTASVVLTILNTEQWFAERNVDVTITASTTDSINVQDSMSSVLIRSAQQPPQVKMLEPSSAPVGAGVHFIKVGFDGASSLDDIKIYWAATGGTSQDGTDHRFLVDQGQRTIIPGATSATLPYEILAGYTASRTLQVDLRYEVSGGYDENLHTFSDITGPLETVTWIEGADASGYGAGGSVQAGYPTDYVSAGVANSATPLLPITDSVKTNPFNGDPLMGFRVNPGAADVGYWRKSFENEIYCDGPQQLKALHPYTRYSLYIAESSDYSGARYVDIGTRDRPNVVTHATVYDSQNDWAAETGKAWYGANSDYGIVTGYHDNGTYYTRLWHIYHEEDSSRTGNPSVPLSHIASSSRHDFAEVSGSGWLIYGQMLEKSFGILSGAPGYYWPKPAHFWDPRGGATLGTGLTRHTATLS